VLWAHLVAVVHALAVVLMVTGALVALRRPRLLWVHAPVAAAILAVNLAGAPCPLTDLELALRERAGGRPYTGGFLGHYALAPFGLDVASPAVQAGIHAVALVPNVLGYGLLAARAGPARRSAARRARTVVSARAEATVPAHPRGAVQRSRLSPRRATAGSRRCGRRVRARRC
jgi:Protein of Unknown function (DUF2784)